ncbi:MAG: hypothetical protein K5867_10305 [Bacteroidales bacterium]|nr:hypothetical protein [Bacteroidales bacterium]
MHPDTEKLISIARGNGFVTRSQREAILNRAKSLGDDMVEVEFILDEIPVRDDPAAPNAQQQNRQQYANAAPQRPAAQQSQDTKKKKKTWLWVGIGGAVAVLVIIIAVASGGKSNDYTYGGNTYGIASDGNTYGLTSGRNAYDDKLDNLENGYTKLMSALQNGDDGNIGDYINLGNLVLLENELESAQNEGKLTQEQSYRYQQIQYMYGMNMGAALLENL